MISRTESAASAGLKRTSALSQRVVSGVVTAAIWIVAVLAGKGAFSLFVGALVVLSVDELTTLLRWRGFPVSRALSVAAGAAIALLTFLGGTDGLMAGVVLVLLVLLIKHTFMASRLTDTALTILAILYVGAMLSFLILVYGLPGGQAAALAVITGTAACDIAAYFAGSALGKTPLAPGISAKKTWEGTVAGVIAPAIIVGTAGAVPWFGLSGGDWMIGLMKGAVAGTVIGTVAPLGDLTESKFKRELNIKDTGRVIPGHGGFLDRLDSLLFTGVVMYYVWPFLAQ
ncbi:MAG: phosphatidate cytidylyltransferase [Candidatus Aquicultorales bacterium]